ncbi:unnamed protein product [Amoebophrya sp. A120]|nr:unnamed protein product [Amoebophrya sp. A120]|eukprot:GSA120T00008018001.1
MAIHSTPEPGLCRLPRTTTNANRPTTRTTAKLSRPKDRTSAPPTEVLSKSRTSGRPTQAAPAIVEDAVPFGELLPRYRVRTPTLLYNRPGSVGSNAIAEIGADVVVTQLYDKEVSLEGGSKQILVYVDPIAGWVHADQITLLPPNCWLKPVFGTTSHNSKSSDKMNHNTNGANKSTSSSSFMKWEWQKYKVEESRKLNLSVLAEMVILNQKAYDVEDCFANEIVTRLPGPLRVTKCGTVRCLFLRSEVSFAVGWASLDRSARGKPQLVQEVVEEGESIQEEFVLGGNSRETESSSVIDELQQDDHCHEENSCEIKNRNDWRKQRLDEIQIVQQEHRMNSPSCSSSRRSSRQELEIGPLVSTAPAFVQDDHSWGCCGVFAKTFASLPSPKRTSLSPITRTTGKGKTKDGPESRAAASSSSCSSSSPRSHSKSDVSSSSSEESNRECGLEEQLRAVCAEEEQEDVISSGVKLLPSASSVAATSSFGTSNFAPAVKRWNAASESTRKVDVLADEATSSVVYPPNKDASNHDSPLEQAQSSSLVCSSTASSSSGNTLMLHENVGVKNGTPTDEEPSTTCGTPTSPGTGTSCTSSCGASGTASSNSSASSSLNTPQQLLARNLRAKDQGQPNFSSDCGRDDGIIEEEVCTSLDDKILFFPSESLLQARLRNQLANVKPVCKVCYLHVANVAFANCGHVLCAGCSSASNVCPICHKESLKLRLRWD